MQTMDSIKDTVTQDMNQILFRAAVFWRDHVSYAGSK